MEALYTGKGGSRGDAVYEDKALAVAYPLVAQGNVFLLAGRVENLEHARLAIDLNLLAIRVFNGGVVGLYKVVEAQLAARSATAGESRRTGAGITWIVRAVLPTPPSPSTTSLYSVILPAILPVEELDEARKGTRSKSAGGMGDRRDQKITDGHRGIEAGRQRRASWRQVVAEGGS